MSQGRLKIGIAAGGVGVALALLALLLLFSQTAVFGQGRPPLPQVPPERLFDADRNKIFDNLEARMAPVAPQQPFEVIVLFHQPLEELDFEGLQQQLGPFQVGRRFHSINGISTVLTKAGIQQAAALEEVRQIEFDSPVFLHLDGAREWSGVDQARADFPSIDGNADGSPTYSKDDIVIAIIDTGIDTGHVDLDGTKVIAWRDFTRNQLTPYDEDNRCVFHGTHVSSIAAGEGDGDSAFEGVAPGAALVGLKVLSRFGNSCSGSTANVNAAIQWVIDNKLRNSGTEGGDAPDAGINVANMSLGIAGCSDGTDSQSLLVNQAVEAGVVMVVSAGNEGPRRCTVGIPAASEKALTVGAMADVAENGFALASFSSRGPTAIGRLKPDIASPGVTIRAASGGTSSAYKNLSGTSMASPLTAGTAALVLHANPTLTAQEVKDLLMLNAQDWGPLDGATNVWATGAFAVHSGPRSDIDWGAGRLDAYQAVKAALQSGGANIVAPQHQFFEDSLTADPGANPQDLYNLTISTTTLPIAATLIMPTWVSGQPDFDMQLRDKDGNLVASSGTVSRQETIRFGPPAAAGPYTLRIFAWPGSPGSPPSVAGPYLLDISAGTMTVGISLTTDGWTPFGSRLLGASVDTTSGGGGTNDVQTVQVTTGPVDLFIRTTLFTDGENTWSLDTTSGPDQVKWEFSPDGTAWTTFSSDNMLFTLATSVAQGATQDIFFRLTMPLDTSSVKEHGVSVTLVAVEPPP